MNFDLQNNGFFPEKLPSLRKICGNEPLTSSGA